MLQRFCPFKRQGIIDGDTNKPLADQQLDKRETTAFRSWDSKRSQLQSQASRIVYLSKSGVRGTALPGWLFSIVFSKRKVDCDVS